MQIRILEYTSDRTFLIELDLTGYDLLRFPKAPWAMYDIDSRVLTDIISRVNLKPLRYWSSVPHSLTWHKTYSPHNRYNKTYTIYRTYVIKD